MTIKPVIYRNTRFEKCLGVMRKAGGVALLAAERAGGIIERLAGLDGCLKEMGKVTRNGEARIKNCVKFDLGGGYRLVCRKEGGRLLLAYAGTHDGCDRWINNNRWRQAFTAGGILDVASPPERSAMAEPDGADTQSQEDYEDILLGRIGERELRAIFGGLCR